MKAKHILLAAVAYFAYTIVSKTGAASRLRFLFDNAAFQQGKLRLGFFIQNPSNTTLTIRSISGDVYANGQYVGNASAFATQVIRPNSQSRFDIVFAPSIASIALFIANAVRTKFALTLRFDGVVNAEGAAIPVSSETKLA